MLKNNQREYIKKNQDRRVSQQARMESLLARHIILKREKELITIPEEELPEIVDKLARERQNSRHNM